MSNDDTGHYLNGIFIHPTASNKTSYLTGVATDTHRLSSSSIPVQDIKNLKSFILPKNMCNDFISSPSSRESTIGSKLFPHSCAYSKISSMLSNT